MALNLACFDGLETACNDLDQTASGLQGEYEELLGALRDAKDEVSHALKETVDAINDRRNRLVLDFEELVEDTLPVMYDDLDASLEQSITDAFDACEEVVNETIEASAEAIDELCDDIKKAAEDAAADLLGAGSEVLQELQSNLKQQVVEHGERQASEFCERILVDLAEQTGLDIVASGAASSLSSAMSAALPYLVVAKAALGSIRRALDLVR